MTTELLLKVAAGSAIMAAGFAYHLISLRVKTRAEAIAIIFWQTAATVALLSIDAPLVSIILATAVIYAVSALSDITLKKIRDARLKKKKRRALEKIKESL